MKEKPKKNSSKWVWVVGGLVAISGISFLTTNNESTVVTNNAPIVKANDILPIKQIAGQSRKQVEQVLGKGAFASNWKDSRAGCKACPKYLYRKDSVEVIYIGGKADRITVNGLAGYQFAPAVSQGLGLSPEQPGFSNSDVMRWYNYEGLREVMAFNDGQGKVNYMLIKTKAE